MLAAEGLIPAEIPETAIAQARAASAASGRPIITVLEETLGIPTHDFTHRLARTFGLPAADMPELSGSQPDFDLLPYADCVRRQCVALRAELGPLRVVIADPFDESIFAWTDARIRVPFERCVSHASDVSAYLARHDEGLSTVAALLPTVGAETRGSAEIEDLSLQAIAEDASPVVKLVRSTLHDALKAGVSDIHLESDAVGLTIKYRLDGVLNTVGKLEGVDRAEQVLSRIKVLSELDIAERRIPQDGRFRASMRGRDIDFRVSVMPSVFGEDAVLRILDKQSLADEIRGLTLDSLGFDASTKDTIRKLAARPYGMLLVTGPTGSGKTTSLYAAISEINHGRDKIITIEDPVEYHLPGVLQIPVNEKKGLTFARGLRSILRHDPDRVMVGEIRDSETAQIAIQAALTGHLVFTTVHANNVFDVLGRFTHMNVDPHSFVAALNGIVAQRLVRRNCPRCAAARKPSDTLIEESGLTAAQTAAYAFTSGAGCGYCRGTGYRGRQAIAETLVLDDELREMIVAREPLRRLKAAALARGTVYLRDAALRLVAEGVTDLAEINRVTLVS